MLTFLGVWVVFTLFANHASGIGSVKLGGVGGGAAGGGSGRYGAADRVDAALLVQLEAEPLKFAVKSLNDADVAFLKRSFTE